MPNKHAHHKTPTHINNPAKTFSWWFKLFLALFYIALVITLVAGIPTAFATRKKPDIKRDQTTALNYAPARISLKLDDSSLPVNDYPKISSYKELIDISRSYMLSIEDHYDDLVSLAQKTKLSDAMGILDELSHGMVMSVSHPDTDNSLRYQVLNSLRFLQQMELSPTLTERKLQHFEQKMNNYIALAQQLFAHDSSQFRQQFFSLYLERGLIYLQHQQWLPAYVYLKMAHTAGIAINNQASALFKTCPQDKIIYPRLHALLHTATAHHYFQTAKYFTGLFLLVGLIYWTIKKCQPSRQSTRQPSANKFDNSPAKLFLPKRKFLPNSEQLLEEKFIEQQQKLDCMASKIASIENQFSEVLMALHTTINNKSTEFNSALDLLDGKQKISIEKLREKQQLLCHELLTTKASQRRKVDIEKIIEKILALENDINNTYPKSALADIEWRINKFLRHSERKNHSTSLSLSNTEQQTAFFSSNNTAENPGLNNNTKKIWR